MNRAAFHPSARAEYLEAVAWYERERPGLGAQLFDEIEARLERALAVPNAGLLEATAPPEAELRWHRLRRFPYALLIGLARGERMVIAVAHERRAPGYWRERLP